MAEYFFTHGIPDSVPHNALFDTFGVVSVIQSSTSMEQENWNSSVFHTAWTDLTQPLEAIFASFSPTKRNEINKIRNKNDGAVNYQVLPNTTENLQRFVTFFNTFAQSKKLPKITLSEIQALQNHLCLTMMAHNGTPIVYHAYIVDGTQRTRLYKSCSQFRNLTTSTEKNWVWYCNNYCHYRDIEYFQQQHVQIYDWGGLSLDTAGEVQSIDAFKLAFRPTIHTEYNAIHYGTAFRCLFAGLSFFTSFLHKKWAHTTPTSS